MNLGSPDSPDFNDVKKYLTEFLMDERVIDYPYLLRTILVKGLIIPFRVAKSAEAYQKIWRSDGSPLVILTRQLQDALKKNIEEPIEIAMRYGNPSAKTAYRNLVRSNSSLEEVLLLPLYPHYAMSSYETAVEHMKQVHQKRKYSFKLKVVSPFYNNENYIDALAESIKPYLNDSYDKILFSYHGIPERQIRKEDMTGNHCLKSSNCCETNSPCHAFCYRHQVKETTRLVIEKLQIPSNKYTISFQSRLGKGWLQPFTDKLLEQMPKNGIKKLLILCPAFVSDCLETLEEIEIRGKQVFMNAGGENFQFIPCLNTQACWIKAVAEMIK